MKTTKYTETKISPKELEVLLRPIFTENDKAKVELYFKIEEVDGDPLDLYPGLDTVTSITVKVTEDD